MSKQKSALDQMNAIKPRNNDVPAMMKRKSGAHTKSRKAKRQQEKAALRNELPFFMLTTLLVH